MMNITIIVFNKAVRRGVNIWDNKQYRCKTNTNKAKQNSLLQELGYLGEEKAGKADLGPVLS